MNKAKLTGYHEKYPKCVEFIIDIIIFCSKLLCFSWPQRAKINHWIKQKDFIFKLRFALWIINNRFKIIVAQDINFRPFISLDFVVDDYNHEDNVKVNLQSCQVIYEQIQKKKSSSSIFRINQADILCHLDAVKGRDQLSLCYQEIIESFKTADSQSKDDIENSAPINTQLIKQHTKRKDYNTDNLDNALTYIISILKENRIDYFLMSGTLLGLIRNKKPLKDDDIDIGVYSSQNNIMQLLTIIKSVNSSMKSNKDYIHIEEIQAPFIIKLKLYSVSIDLFFHFQEDNQIWHGSIYHRWYNHKIDIDTLEYNNTSYLIPRDFDLYLTENYGDWKTPVSNFSIYRDCPNYRPQYNLDALVFFLKNCLSALPEDHRGYLIFSNLCKKIYSNIFY